MERYDAVVVGGGPAGAATAVLLARRGWRVALVDARRPGATKACGHCLNRRAVVTLERLGLTPPDAVVAGRTQRLRLHVTPGGPRPSLELDLGAQPGLLIDRARFDSWLIDEACAAGADVWQPARAMVRRLDREARLDVRTSDGARTITASLVVGADGLGSVVARAAGLARTGGQGRAYGFSFDLTHSAAAALDDDAIHMLTSVAGYLGVVRTNRGSLHVGALVRHRSAHRSPTAFLADLARRHPMLHALGLDQQERWRWFASIAPIPWRVCSVTAGCTALVGDAAGYVEPFTGEGLAWSLESAECLEQAVRAQRVGIWSRTERQTYRRLWKQRVGRRQRFCRRVSWLLRRPRLLELAAAAASRASAFSEQVILSRMATP